LAKPTSPFCEGPSEYQAIPCSFSLKSILELNSMISASGDPEACSHRREFWNLAFTSLLLSGVTKLQASNPICEAAEEMHWNAVGCSENALDVAAMNISSDAPVSRVAALSVMHG
jgi:hypothetical protein